MASNGKRPTSAAEGAPAAKVARKAGMPVTQLRSLRLMTAIKTPYTAGGDIDYEAFDKHVEFQIRGGVEGLILGGTTGEGHLLSWEEHLALIAHAVGKFKGRIALVGNTGSNHTAEAVKATRKGFALGMDCALLINPYYGKTSAIGVKTHLERAMDLGPGIIYNVPGRTGQDIPAELMFELMDHKNFVGVKECMGHERVEQLSKRGIAVWSGNDDQCHLSRHKYGAVGVISVTSNIVPGLFHKLMHGKQDDALDAKLTPLYKWLFKEPNPIGVNTMLMMLGAAEPVFRLPYVFLPKEMRAEGVKLLEAIGLENCPASEGAELKVMEDTDFELTLGDD